MSGKVLDLEAESGRGQSAITLEDVQATAIAHGFAKTNVDSRKPLRCRADLHAFFSAYGVKAFTPFKQLFETRRLLPPGEGGFADSGASSETSDLDSATTVEPMPIERYEELSSSFDKLKWRLHARPGGATTRPDDFYRLTGAHTAFERAKMHVEKGNCEEPKPIWDSSGSLDFHGRECWEAWRAFKGMSREDAKHAFCSIYAEALERRSTNFRG